MVVQKCNLVIYRINLDFSRKQSKRRAVSLAAIARLLVTLYTVFHKKQPRYFQL